MAVFDKELAEALCSLEVPKRIKFSPDGSKVVYATALASGSLRKGKHRISTLWVASAFDPRSARKLTSGQTNNVQHVWHPDGNQVVFLSDRSHPGESFSIWILRLDGGDPVLISGSAAVRAFAISPDGKTVAYTSVDETSREQKDQDKQRDGTPNPNVWGDDSHLHAKLRLVELSTGVIRTLHTGKGHVIDFSWSPDGARLVFATVQNLDPEEKQITGTTLSTVSVEDEKLTVVCTVSKSVFCLTWASDGKIYYIDRAVLDSCWCGNAVYAIEPSQSPSIPVKKVSGDDDDATDLILACGQALVTRSIRTGTLISDVDGRPIFERALEFLVYDAHYNPEMKSWTVAAALSNVNMPAEVTVFRSGQAAITLSEHGEGFVGREFGSFNILTCQSSDQSVELDGVYLTPAGTDERDGVPTTPLPTAVLIHGGPMDRNHNTFDSNGLYWAPYLLAKGYGVLLPQYRGSTGRGSRFAAYTSTGHGRENYDDIITITDNAIRKGFVDSKRLLVGGWSMGGIMTYLCSVRNGRHGLGWRFNAAIAGAGICDMDSAMISSDVGSSGHAELGGGRAPWNSSEDGTSARRGSALWQVAGAVEETRRTGEMVIPPMLILHGDQDTRAPFTQAQGFRRALRAHNLPCEFVSYSGQGHTPGPMFYWLDMLERVARYCHVYIGPGHSPDWSG